MPIVADPTPIESPNPTTPVTTLYGFDGKIVYDDVTLDILPGATVTMYATLADAQADTRRVPLYNLLGQAIASLTANAKGYVPSWRAAAPRGVLRSGGNFQSVISLDWVESEIVAARIAQRDHETRIAFLEGR